MCNFTCLHDLYVFGEKNAYKPSILVLSAVFLDFNKGDNLFMLDSVIVCLSPLAAQRLISNRNMLLFIVHIKPV